MPNVQSEINDVSIGHILIALWTGLRRRTHTRGHKVLCNAISHYRLDCTVPVGVLVADRRMWDQDSEFGHYLVQTLPQPLSLSILRAHTFIVYRLRIQLTSYTGWNPAKWWSGTACSTDVVYSELLADMKVTDW
jgi:hypothetical protein